MKVVKKEPGRFWLPGSPLLLEGQTLWEEEETGLRSLELRWRNISGKLVSAASVAVRCLDGDGAVLGDVEEFAYRGLEALPRDVFGEKVSIDLPYSRTERWIVLLQSAEFSGGERWTPPGPELEPPSPLPEPRSLDSLGKLEEQYRRTVPKACQKNLLLEGDGFWQCGCGAVNLDPQEPCAACGMTLSALREAEDPEKLEAAQKQYEANKEQEALRAEKERLERLEADRERREQALTAKEKKRRFLRRAGLCLGAAALVTGIAAGLWLNSDEHAYRQAEELLQKKRLDQAEEGFLALGDYRSSRQYVERIREERKKSEYYAAVSLMDGNQYHQAAQAFRELGDFRDSKALYSQNMYRYAKELMENGDYSQASLCFRKIPSYEDSLTQSSECQYLLALEEMDRLEYLSAYDRFQDLADYKDSPEKSFDCALQQGRQELKSGSFENAKQWFALLPESHAAQVSAALLQQGKDCLDQGDILLATLCLGELPQDYPELEAAWEELLERKAQIIRERSWCRHTDALHIRDSGKLYIDYFEFGDSEEAKAWKDPVSVWEDWGLLAMVAKDGTVHAHSKRHWDDLNIAIAAKMEQWTDIVSLSGELGVRSDGTVVFADPLEEEEKDIAEWRDILVVSQSTYGGLSLGLKRDGTVVAAGKNASLCDVSGWRDMAYILASEDTAIGIDWSGQVYLSGAHTQVKGPLTGAIKAASYGERYAILTDQGVTSMLEHTAFSYYYAYATYGRRTPEGDWDEIFARDEDVIWVGKDGSGPDLVWSIFEDEKR